MISQHERENALANQHALPSDTAQPKEARTSLGAKVSIVLLSHARSAFHRAADLYAPSSQ